MRNGIFRPSDFCGYTRAANVMSTESATEFEWSVKLLGTANIDVGIASQLEPKKTDIRKFDQNAIFYSSYASEIRNGLNTMYKFPTKYRSGDVIRFRFQPHAKKLLINSVRY